MNVQNLRSFLLVDSAQLASAASVRIELSDRLTWVLPVYGEAAISVSPLVIDIHGAYECDQLDEMITMLNALHPQLHVSIMDTALSHAALVEHLRRFIMIKTDDRRALTLRFADCLGLPVLADAFSAEQWSTFAAPIGRWSVHCRNGALRTLPQPDRQLAPVPTPLVLTQQQIAVLAEATAPDEMIANIREMRHDMPMPGSPLEQHAWAVAARQIWRSVGSADLLVLRWLTAAALDSRGKALEQPYLPELLVLQDKSAVRLGLGEYGSIR